MTRKFCNWSYHNITEFLKHHGFQYSEGLNEFHESWIKFDKCGPDRIVEVRITHNIYPSKMVKTMIRQSGIPEDQWIEWAES